MEKYHDFQCQKSAQRTSHNKYRKTNHQDWKYEGRDFGHAPKHEAGLNKRLST